MSIVRWSEDSSVYVYDHLSGEWCCCDCGLDGRISLALFSTTPALIAHLREHVAKGDRVPDWVFTELEKEIDDDRG